MKIIWKPQIELWEESVIRRPETCPSLQKVEHYGIIDNTQMRDRVLWGSVDDDDYNSCKV